MITLKRFEQVELVIPANSGASVYPYPDIPKLRDDTTQDILVTALETYPAEAIPFSPTGNPVATQAQLQNLFLTLYVENEESIVEIPLTRLNQIFASLATSPILATLEKQGCAHLKVDWNKSFLTAAVPPNSGGANAQFSVLLGVDYRKLAPGMWAQITAGQIKGM
jgi:hypothetical protein